MTSVTRRVISRVVRDRRLALGLSQRELADTSGLSLAMVRDLEQGRTRRPRPASIDRLSQVLGVDPRTGNVPPPGDESTHVSRLQPPTLETGPAIRFLILGVLEAQSHGVVVGLGAGKLRSLVAYLALNAGAVINRDSLIDLLWDDTLPLLARDRLGEYIRKANELLSSATTGKPSDESPNLIERVGSGYRLSADACRRDTDEFLRLSDRGRAALKAGMHSEAADLLDRALKLWRGEVMPEIEALREHPEVVALRRRRGGAARDIADALFALGRRDEALIHLETAAARDPFDESMQGQLLLMLARCGRQSEALSRYQRFSQRLNEELGVRPGRELVDVQRRILHQELEPAVGVAYRSRTVPRQLPAAGPLFIGRDSELHAVVEHVEHTIRDRDLGTAPIVAIDGMAGVGKTAFVVRTAHHLAARFPDGQLFVDLLGHCAELPPRQPHQVLDELLNALGVSLSLVPTDPEARAALYRDRLAETRTLIVLDNAAEADQVRPLLPSSGRCLVLVTSRRRLTPLDETHRLTLDELRVEDAHRLLVQMAPRSSQIGSSESLRDLVSLCGKLPLTVRIVGALLRQRPWLTPNTVADRLRSSLTGPNPLSVFDDGDRSLQSIFDLSYRALRPQQQDMFRALSGMPGPDIDAHVASALAVTDIRTSENLLYELADHSLLVETAPGRFQLHDLIRLHAETRNADRDTTETAAATERLLEYFDTTARLAQELTAQHTPVNHDGPVDSPRFESRQQAVDWIQRNTSNLLAVAHLAATIADHRRVISLAASLYDFLRIHGPWSDVLKLLEAAVDAADTLGTPVTGAVARTRLGVIKRLTGDFPGSVTVLRFAAAQLEPHKDSPELVNVFRELGETYRVKGEYSYAEAALRAALAQRALTEDPLGRAETLTSLGALALTCASDPHDAIQLLQEAVVIYHENEDRAGKITALTYLGDLHRILGNYPEGHHILEMALDETNSVDDHLVQANVLVRLGYLRYLLGQHEAADSAFREGLEMFLRLGSLVGEANTLIYLGVTRSAVGEHANAVDILHRAQDIYTSLGNERGKAMALMHGAQALHGRDDRETAGRYLARAMTFFQDADDTVNQAHAFTLRGEFAFADGAFDQAYDHYDRAAALARLNGRHATEAAALRGMGTTAIASGDVAQGTHHLESALELYRSLGSPNTEGVESELRETRNASG